MFVVITPSDNPGNKSYNSQAFGPFDSDVDARNNANFFMHGVAVTIAEVRPINEFHKDVKKECKA